MGFPRKIKDQILADTARHCCVCHRYKGVKVEVHHIEQEALGGSNKYENAIALCFDCHADAGHYNPKHPRGTKFSPGELKKAKAQWLEIVRTNNIKVPSEPDSFLCQYFVCENYENLEEIAKGDLSKFPVNKPLLVKNEIIQYLEKVIQNHPESYRHANAWGERYKSKKDYLDRHPDAVVTKEGQDEYSYFEVVRTPTIEELKKYSEKDGLLKLMLKAGMPIDNVSAIIGCYENACGGIEFQEEYIFRKLWCSFAAITNISDQPLSLDSIDAQNQVYDGFTKFDQPVDSLENIPLPKMPIQAGATVLFPMALLLPPLHSLSRQKWSSSSSGGWEEQVQIVSHGNITENNVSEVHTFGGRKLPEKLHFIKNGNRISQEFHTFDLSNMYSIERHWQCGSCPHLFFVSDKVVYVKELLSHCENKKGEERFFVPEDVRAVIIAEIEDETTELHSIMVDKTVYASNITLEKSQHIEIPVSGGSKITVTGKYIPYGKSNRFIPQGIKRNDLVGEFLFLTKE